MEIELFEGQAAFLADYKEAAKDIKTDETILDDVLAQLNQQLTEEELVYTLAAENSQTGKAKRFPFKKMMYSEEIDAMVTTRFIYQGEPYIYEPVQDELL